MGMEFRSGESRHRKPFTDEQLLAIQEAAKSDPEVAPLFVLGINTHGE